MILWAAAILAVGMIIAAADIANAIRDSAKARLVHRAWGGGHDD